MEHAGYMSASGMRLYRAHNIRRPYVHLEHACSELNTFAARWIRDSAVPQAWMYGACYPPHWTATVARRNQSGCTPRMDHACSRLGYNGGTHGPLDQACFWRGYTWEHVAIWIGCVACGEQTGFIGPYIPTDSANVPCTVNLYDRHCELNNAAMRALFDYDWLPFRRMDHSARIVAGPVNPQGRLLVSTWDSKVFLPPRIVTDGSHSREKVAPVVAPAMYGTSSIVKQPEIGGTHSGTGSIASTGIRYAWAATEVDSATDFPAEPPESAGVLLPASTDRPTLEGTPGSIRIYLSVKDKEFRVWVLRSIGGHSKWVISMSGDLHPNQEALQGYRLNMRNPRAPSWVQEKTYRMYEAPSKRVEWWKN
ncbi:hypothetical protein BKA62DRAFT_668139 [Auriculariales sp. MPI-PUGE-AT-0066]|nr:hypothetical protein BKA62DRAFT_668139 [Auriculariales sp. MPI-PUGE-AT-0066]